EQGTKETVVLQGSHVGIRKKSAGIFSDTDAKGTARAVPFIYRGDLSRVVPLLWERIYPRKQYGRRCIYQFKHWCLS
ncbi:MAG TPA: hypothetical protein VF671_18220, partial [Pseudomonas sp.]|uniref:hypothetical protein n=1 Tax=Pseudomonas sp. TaxID=306 RepID=UPI002EDABF68